MQEHLESGALVYDPRTRKVGTLQAKVGPYVLLRPVGGGREWEADPVRIRAATTEERLAAGLRAANERSTGTGRRVFRYVPYSIVQDASAQPEYEARCVSGDEADCGATSGLCAHPADVEEWQRRHTQETRHTRYRRGFMDYAVLERQG
ncbi:hypothetical protein ACIQ6Y_31375 [Streptomyces sp. NPDC096205]|uniref:DUF7848 domain-containing protein n=1 Tax=Streptomyces sp. NPDC096205 TaxID=3366081 RepID=UPI00381D3696